jgi:mono/diheme cytochrome c family protein
MRYKETWREVAYTTIVKGRSDLGMPVWGGVIPEDEIKAIIKFLETVQKN